MLPTARKLAFTDVPVIDLAPAWSGGSAARRALADEIAEACGTVGFMYVKNHRVADADVEAIFQTAADFHNLPHDVKMASAMARNARMSFLPLPSSGITGGSCDDYLISGVRICSGRKPMPMARAGIRWRMGNRASKRGKSGGLIFSRLPKT